ncbi:MAG: response regulator [Desulfomonile tiedjei]|uniref:Response regulator n=1 Tax=Desulfomonile tiedjei TaxID=2358 RepID=A0A9D6V2W2_9BACT|nr:response regulator [Desulfomonile tiedjei]
MGPSVLIVDDNASLAYFTAYSLKQEVEGLKVVTAGSCKEALVLADEHHPSVLIVDLKLPDGNGLKLIDDLKSRLPSTIPILVTATPLPADLNRELFGMLTKPYDPEALIDLVRRALKSGDSRDERDTGRYHRGETRLPSAQYDFHHVQNRLSGLLAGIRALRLELLAVADNPSEVRRIIDEYTDRLSAMAKEAAEALKKKA